MTGFNFSTFSNFFSSFNPSKFSFNFWRRGEQLAMVGMSLEFGSILGSEMWVSSSKKFSSRTHSKNDQISGSIVGTSEEWLSSWENLSAYLALNNKFKKMNKKYKIMQKKLIPDFDAHHSNQIFVEGPFHEFENILTGHEGMS